MKGILLAGLLLALPVSSLATQDSWSPPLSLRWSRVDLAIHRDSADIITMYTYPVPGSTTDPVARVLRSTSFRLDVTRRWLETVRQMADSVDRLDRVKGTGSRGRLLPGTVGDAGLVIGYDRSQKSDSRYFLLLRDTLGVEMWSTVGARRDVDSLMLVMQRAMDAPQRRYTTRGKPTCLGLVPASYLSNKKSLGIKDRGGVSLTFLIDTAGAPIDSTVDIMLTSGPKQTEAVRAFLRTAIYRPARCPAGPVEMLVTQMFVGNVGN